MNKQELIDHCKILKKDKNRFINCIDVDRIINTIKQLDEPPKVTVPQFAADWIEVCKENLAIGLYTAMNPDFMKENNQSFDFILWIKKASNQETFARAWIFGYEVEKEKRYKISVKSNKQILIKFQNRLKKWFEFADIKIKEPYYTRKELEEVGFGWVFDCEGIEIEEVE